MKSTKPKTKPYKSTISTSFSVSTYAPFNVKPRAAGGGECFREIAIESCHLDRDFDITRCPQGMEFDLAAILENHQSLEMKVTRSKPFLCLLWLFTFRLQIMSKRRVLVNIFMYLSWWYFLGCLALLLTPCEVIKPIHTCFHPINYYIFGCNYLTVTETVTPGEGIWHLLVFQE